MSLTLNHKRQNLKKYFSLLVAVISLSILFVWRDAGTASLSPMKASQLNTTTLRNSLPSKGTPCREKFPWIEADVEKILSMPGKYFFDFIIPTYSALVQTFHAKQDLVLLLTNVDADHHLRSFVEEVITGSNMANLSFALAGKFELAAASNFEGMECLSFRLLQRFNLQELEYKRSGDFMLAIPSGVVLFNRHTLELVQPWLPDNETHEITLASQLNELRYGMSNITQKHINSIPNNEATLADLLCNELLKHGAWTYLELGVSVGKTFFQVLKFAETHSRGYKMAGLSSETALPVVSRLLEGNAGTRSDIGFSAEHVSSSRGFRNTTVKEWKSNSGTVMHIIGDESEDTAWRTLRHYSHYASPFIVINSGTLHGPHALLAQFKILLSNSILDVVFEFMYFIDNPQGSGNGSMWEAALGIVKNIQFSYPSLLVEARQLEINGWAGEYGNKHQIIIISANHYWK